MPADPGPHRFEDVRLILAPDGEATTKAVTPNFYAELDSEFDQFKGHILVRERSMPKRRAAGNPEPLLYN